MKLNSRYLDHQLQQGILLLQSYGFAEEDSSALPVYAEQGETIHVNKTDKAIHIVYDSIPHFYMALARSTIMKCGMHSVESKAKRLGFMLDCSRNAVPKPKMVKELICMLLLAGYDYLELYTEVTYELPGEPYFGYKLGRYSTEELKEIIAFARTFEFAMVPCIQTLAHLMQLNNWMPYYDYMDIDDILLTGDERTYELIRKCICHCKEVFQTTRINIGSDEARRQGRGKYTDRYGYKSKDALYLEHMERVFQICREEGVEPEFWADAFYHTDRTDEQIMNIFDGSQLPIVWRYADCEADDARRFLTRCKKCAGKVMFAAGLWKWYGFAPENLYTQKSLDRLFEATDECKVDDILITAWGNDGNECTVIAVMSSLWYAAHKLYPCDVDLSDLLFEMTGYTKAEWETTDKLNYMMPALERQSNAAKYMLYNDFLIGLMDYNIPYHASEIYESILPELLVLAAKENRYSYVFASYAALCRVLVRKSTYGKRLHRAYQDNDKQKMQELLEEIHLIREDLKEFLKVYRKQWMKENKGFGFEIIDVRVGGMISRTDTVQMLVSDYLTGRIEKIYELEEERLEYFNDRLTGEESYAALHPIWGTLFTVNIVSE